MVRACDETLLDVFQAVREHVMHVLTGTVLTPKPRGELHHLPWGQIMTEQAPRPAAPDTIKDPITILFPGRTCVV
jgi:hypothetical protein